MRRTIGVAALLVLIMGCSKSRAAVVGGQDLVGAEVAVDGASIGHLAKKRIFELISVDRGWPRLHSRTIAELKLPSVGPGWHQLTVKNSRTEIRLSFHHDTLLIDLSNQRGEHSAE